MRIAEAAALGTCTEEVIESGAVDLEEPGAGGQAACLVVGRSQHLPRESATPIDHHQQSADRDRLGARRGVLQPLLYQSDITAASTDIATTAGRSMQKTNADSNLSPLAAFRKALRRGAGLVEFL